MSKVYLMTGGSSDLAVSFMKRLDECSEECKVYATYFSSKDLLYDAVNTCKHIHIIPIKCDLRNEDEVYQLISYLEKVNDIPQYYINCAASKFEYMRLKDFDWPRVKQEMDIQIGSMALVLKWLLPHMAKNKFGRILAIGTAYLCGTPPKFMSAYIISKYALEGYVKSIASEYGDKGITANILSPAMMETKFLTNLDHRTAEINAKNSMMKRNISLSEVTEAMLYLLSDKSGFTNGINMNLSGGEYM